MMIRSVLKRWIGGRRATPVEDELAAMIRRRRAADCYIPSPTCQVPGLTELYERCFGFRREGVFVEVGAFDGEYVSNTSCLADIGWRGLYVEPVPQFADRCRARHAGNRAVTVAPYAVGEEEGQATIHLGGALSTADAGVVQLFKSLDWARHSHDGTTVTVPRTTLDRLLREHAIEPEFDLLVIDVEGGEWSVLKPFDLAHWSPRMVIIELHDQNDQYLAIRDRCLAIVDYFERHRYVVLYKDSTNTVYVRPDAAPAADGAAKREGASPA